MSSTAEPSPSGTPSNCPYGFCGNYCLETSSSVCCTGSNSGNSSGTVQCGNNWFCSETASHCCPSANQSYCSGADKCIDTSAGQSCCGPTVCPQNQTCASSGDRCCPDTQTTCATDWWYPSSTSVTVISMTTTPTTLPTTTTTSGKSSSTSSTHTATSSPTSSSNLGTGAKAGIAVGSIIGAVALIGFLLLFLKRRSDSRSRSGPNYAATGISEYEPSTTYNNGGSGDAYSSGYGTERRETIPLVPTVVPPVHDESHDAYTYPERPEHLEHSEYEHPGQQIFSQHAPSYPTIPRVE